MSVKKPATIAELKQWYEEHHLPPEEITRFFIGVNCQRPRAFGIYQDGDSFVVYKNKDNGSRVVRYSGPDEAYAVNELWARLKQEITDQKNNQPASAKEQQGASGQYAGTAIATICIVMTMLLCVIGFMGAFGPDNGYYAYNAQDTVIQDYYYLEGSWYYFDNGQTYNDYAWHKIKPPAELKKNWKTYYQGSDYSEAYEVTDFRDTTYYADYESSQSSSDSYDWGSSDSWDSGSTDFSSDW